MNFLQLCQRLRSEAGIAGVGPSTVINQSGELGRIVNHIQDAYEDIQNKHDDWSFLRNDFSFNCVIGTQNYAQSTVANLSNWKKDSFRLYLTTINDEQWIRYMEWDLFRDSRLYGPISTTTGRPIDFTVKPDKSLSVWPIPDNTYTIRGEYYRIPYVLSVDADVPIFDRYHMAIVFNALMRYAAFVSDPTLYAYAQKEYGRLIGKLERERAMSIGISGAMA